MAISPSTATALGIYFAVIIHVCLYSRICAGLEIPWLRVRISAGRALQEMQCTLKGQARYVNVRGSVHWKGVHRVGDRDLGCKIFLIGY